jgi:hypothetical protein
MKIEISSQPPQINTVYQSIAPDQTTQKYDWHFNTTQKHQIAVLQKSR